MTTQSSTLVLDVREAAQALKCSPDMVRALIRSGRFPCQRIGGKIIVSIKLIEKMAESEETMPPRFLGKR